MLFAIMARDRPGALQVRLDTRAAHLAYIEATGIVSMAGPLIEDGQMCGSLIVVDTGNLKDAKDWVEGDPYGKAGLFESVSVTEWKKVIG